jgi:hypothetical protein
LRVFRLKAFGRFQRREKIADRALAKAVRDAEKGRVDADLGGGLIKQRVARAGEGKSGGFRTVIAYRRGSRAVFLYGFAKSDRDNISAEERLEWQRVGRELLRLDADQVRAAIAAGNLDEVNYDDEA